VLLGQNGAGKTTFLKLLAGQIESDNSTEEKVNPSIISFKQQRLNLLQGIRSEDPNILDNLTVEQFIIKKIGMYYYEPSFREEVLKTLNIDNIKNNLIARLSGGEMQKIAICICLGNQDAQLYLIDEPSAFLDVEQRLIISKLLRRFIYQHAKTAFIVEHDILMASYLADKIIVFKRDNLNTIVSKPETPEIGLHIFLQEMNITMRKDEDNGRPRINKPNSAKDRDQKKSGEYLK
jgi:ATP-binding cassette subfamily E protein 1